ncbi:hypothetical protein LCGC14_2051720 [marine sediment metagenome]|uniref:Uncharacterized protein n=1 Tax=marine sediment metagenome TaxID=412755 RepID=A0A0F9HKW4_9ZZZZ
MKLIAVHEAKYANKAQTQTLERTFTGIRRSLPNVTIDDVAFYCALMTADRFNEDYRVQDFVDIAMNGLPALKNNPRVISEELERYFDSDDPDPQEFIFMIADIVGTLKKHQNDL